MSVPGTNVVVGPYMGDGITTKLNYPFTIDPADLVVFGSPAPQPRG